ncbi:MAG: DegQ family serine endoprotease [Steroidobacteraceae bacterium]|nr:DegQ family serine endoprotease [Steroidobacteraceae bacterium]
MMSRVLEKAVVLISVWLAGCSPQSVATSPKGAAAAVSSTAPAAPAVSAPTVSRALPDFSKLVEEYGDAVVNVVSTRELSARTSFPQFSPDDPFYEFFRRFGIPAPWDRDRGPQLQRGEGSGFIISRDGYILTNAHVVDEATDVTVKLTDRREFTAKVVGSDPRSDVAVLKIDAHDLPTVKIGDSRQLRPGEWVVAIGSPFGFENSVTAGVVSATSRAVGAANSIVPFIQTDVAVNPGNSGGPLFNLRGEVVGINSMIYSGTGGYQGISFAIPIHVALDVQRQLVETGRVVRGRIGVTIQDVNAQLAESFGLDRPRGALVSAVEDGGPAADAGVKPGDVIVAVNDKPIEVSSELPPIIAHLRPGTTATLEVVRDRKKKRLEVKIEELQEPRGSVLARGTDGSDTPRLGVDVRPLTPAEQRQAEVDHGLLVERSTGPALTAGVQRGDIILRVGNTPVESVADLKKAIRDSKGTVALLIQRGDAQLYLPVRLG